MKKLFTIILLLSFCSFCMAQVVTYDSLKQKFTVKITTDRISKNSVYIDLKRYLGEEVANKIANTPQTDFIMSDNSSFVKIKRNEGDGSISLQFEIKELNSDVKDELEKGRYLKTKDSNDSIGISIECIDQLSLLLEMKTQIEDIEKEISGLKPESSGVTRDGDDKLSTAQSLFPIFVDVIIAIIFSVLIIILVYKKIGGKKDENRQDPYLENNVEKVKEVLDKLEICQKKVLNEIAQLNDKIESLQQKQTNDEKENVSHNIVLEPNETVVETKDPSIDIIRKAGYVATPNLNDIYDKDILSTRNEYCIFEVQFVNEKEAKYFINSDPQALPNIVASAYMMGNCCTDETKGKQATEIQTDEPGILQRDGDHWIISKPIKFTIR